MADEARANDMFMKIVLESGVLLDDAIMGEAEDLFHITWIPIESWELGYRNPGTPKEGGEATEIDRAKHDNFKVTKRVDASSASIQKKCWAGETIEKVVIECFRSVALMAGTNIFAYLKIELGDVLIADYELRARQGELPEEELEFYYSEIEFTYRMVEKRTGVMIPYNVKAKFSRPDSEIE